MRSFRRWELNMMEKLQRSIRRHGLRRLRLSAVVCGDVTIGAGTSVGFGAVLTAETGPITIGSKCVIMENAVLRGTKRHPLSISNNVLIGPHAHLTGCTIAENVFIATQVAIFNGASGTYQR